MNILLAAPQYPPHYIGGAELLAQRTARWLIHHGHRVQVVCVGNAADPNQNGALCVTDEIQDGVPVQRLYFNWRHASCSLDWTFDNPLIAAHFDALLRAQRFDAVHLMSGYLLGATPLRVARQWHVPTIVTLTDFWFLCPSLQLLRADGTLCAGPAPSECLHCLFVQDRRATIPAFTVPAITRAAVRVSQQIPGVAQRFELPARLNALERRPGFLARALNSADAIVALTAFVAQLHAANGMNPHRLVVLPDCIDVAEFDLPDQPPVADGVIRFGYLGQMLPIKGVDVLIRAFRKLDRSRRRAQLMLHGPLDPNSKYARVLRHLAGNDPDILFAGGYAHRDAMKILNDVDIVVVPSQWYENSPRVILEAFAAARPVIATNLGGISEIVRAEESGLLFERANVDDLARQMQRVLDDPALAINLRGNIRPSRDVDAYMNDLVNVYRRVIRRQELTHN